MFSLFYYNKSLNKFAIFSQTSVVVERVVSHWTHPWVRRCAAKVDNYKKSGTWKKYSAYCTAKTFGFVSDQVANGNAYCDKQYNFNTGNSYASATAKHVEHYIVVSTKTKSGWVQSVHSVVSSITNTRTLTW